MLGPPTVDSCRQARSSSLDTNPRSLAVQSLALDSGAKDACVRAHQAKRPSVAAVARQDSGAGKSLYFVVGPIQRILAGVQLLQTGKH
jgi:hypothetical protein